MTVWTDKIVRAPLPSGPIDIGTRVRMIKRYTVHGASNSMWDRLSTVGDTATVLDKTLFSGYPVDDDTVIVEWDNPKNGHDGISRIDQSCLAREEL